MRIPVAGLSSVCPDHVAPIANTKQLSTCIQTCLSIYCLLLLTFILNVFSFQKAPLGTVHPKEGAVTLQGGRQPEAGSPTNQLKGFPH